MNLQLSLIALIIHVKLAELKSISSYLSSAATTYEPKNLVLLNMLKLVITSRQQQKLNQTAQALTGIIRKQKRRNARVMTSSSSLGSELLGGGGDEPRQFCGETLYYVVEYYCVYVKGTSVYVPNGDGEEEDENSFDNKKQSDDLKSKRNTIDNNGKLEIT